MRSFRRDKFASVIRNVIGDVISHKLSDPRISMMTSVTRVEVSGDLQHAKVYVSVMGSETEQRRTLIGLSHARAHIQRIVAGKISARQCPQILFVEDDSIKGTARIVKIIQDSLSEDGVKSSDELDGMQDSDSTGEETAS